MEEEGTELWAGLLAAGAGLLHERWAGRAEDENWTDVSATLVWEELGWMGCLKKEKDIKHKYMSNGDFHRI